MLQTILETYKQMKTLADLGWVKAEMKRRMKDNMNGNKDRSIRSMYYQNQKPRYKQVGSEYAKAKAQMKKLGNVQIKTQVELSVFLNYTAALRSANNAASADLLTRYAPNLNKVPEKFSEGVWKAVDITDYLNKPRDYDQSGIMRRFNDLHLVHRSVDDPKQIAYYPTYRHFSEGREVRTKLGKYLTTYKDTYTLSEAEIKYMAEKYSAQVVGETSWKLHYAGSNDPDHWVQVYANGPDSCMAGEDCVRVYAHKESVLKLAYLENGNGAILARCIVRTDDDEKGYLRVYPDPNGYDAGRFLKDALAADGYQNHINLDGVELLAIETDEGYACPYIDSGNNGSQQADYCGGMLVLGSGNIACNNTNGETSNEYDGSCDLCGCDCNRDDLTYIESEERDVCVGCLDQSYVYAKSSNGHEWFTNDEVIYCQTNGEYYVQDDAEYFSIYQCQDDHDWYKRDDLESTSAGLVHHKRCVELDHPDSDGNQYAHEDDVTTLTNGKVCHDDDVEDLQAEINELASEEAMLAAESELELRQATLTTVPTKSEYRELLEVA